MANISGILSSDIRARALARIGYFDDTTKRGRRMDYRRILSWFVVLAGMDLKGASPTELHSLHEDIRALQEERFELAESAAITALHVSRTHATVARHVEQLMSTGRTESEEFPLRVSIFLPRFAPRPAIPLRQNHYIGEFVEPFNGEGLLYLFFEALKHAGDRLRQCPHCSARFVQARRKQVFCARKCQQVATMRDLRDKRRKERDKKSKKTPRPAAVRKRHSVTKGRIRHGEKRR